MPTYLNKVQDFFLKGGMLDVDALHYLRNECGWVKSIWLLRSNLDFIRDRFDFDRFAREHHIPEPQRLLLAALILEDSELYRTSKDIYNAIYDDHHEYIAHRSKTRGAASHDPADLRTASQLCIYINKQDDDIKKRFIAILQKFDPVVAKMVRTIIRSSGKN
jgi:hypothetical protein